MDLTREVYRQGIGAGHRATMGLHLTNRLPKAQKLVEQAMAAAPSGPELVRLVGGAGHAKLVGRIDEEAARLEANRTPDGRSRPKD